MRTSSNSMNGTRIDSKAMADKPSRALVLYGDGLARFIDPSHTHLHSGTGAFSTLVKAPWNHKGLRRSQAGRRNVPRIPKPEVLGTNRITRVARRTEYTE